MYEKIVDFCWAFIAPGTELLTKQCRDYKIEDRGSAGSVVATLWSGYIVSPMLPVVEEMAV